MRSPLHFICLIVALSSFIRAQDSQNSNGDGNDQENKSAIQRAADYIPTGCSVPILQTFGAPNSALINNGTNSVKFDMTAQLNFEAIVGGQRPHIDAIETCGTLELPITDMAIQIGMYDYKSGSIVNRTNYALFGDTDVKVEADTSGGGLFGFGASAAPEQGKVCKEIVLDDDEEIEYGTISTQGDKITKMVFTTTKAKVLVLGFDIQGADAKIFRFNNDEYMLTGFFGTMTKNGDDTYLSQIGFILWLEQCVEPIFVLYFIVAGAALFLIMIICCLVKCCCKARHQRSTQVVYLNEDAENTGRHIKENDIEMYKQRKTSDDEKANDVDVTDA